MPKSVRRFIAFAIPVFVLIGMLQLSGCEGSDAEKAVTKTVDQAVGADAAKQGQQIEQEAKQSMQKEMERSRKDIDPDTAGDDQHGAEETSPK